MAQQKSGIERARLKAQNISNRQRDVWYVLTNRDGTRWDCCNVDAWDHPIPQYKERMDARKAEGWHAVETVRPNKPARLYR